MDNALIIQYHKAKASVTMYEHLGFVSNNRDSYPIIIHSDYLPHLSSVSCDLMGLLLNLKATFS